MNPGTGQEMGAVSPPERREGLPFPKPREFAPGAASPQPVQSKVRPREANDVPPLFTTLIRKSDGTRAVTVSEGCVTEINPKSDAGGGGTVDGVKEWPIDNIWTGSLLTEHGPITVNQAVGIAFDVDAAGFITGNGMIEIRDVGAEQKSLHYAPKVGPTAGTAGDVFVILAILTGTGDSERLTIKHGGSNWPHYHDLPTFTKATGADVDIFDEFDRLTGEYRYLGLKALSPLAAAIVGKNIEFSLTGLDHDLRINFMELVTARPTVVKINIPSLNVTGTTGVMVDDVLTADGEHQHNFSDVQSGGSNYGTFGLTGDDATISTVPEPDGEHIHAVIGTTTAIDESTDPDTRQKITIPGAVTIEIDTEAGYLLYCWRKGVLVGFYANGTGAPALPDGGTTSTWGVFA